MKEEQISAWCDRREKYNRLIIDKWCTNDKPKVALAYWFCVGKNRYRIHEVGNTLLEAIYKCVDKEEKYTAENKDKKDAPTKKK